MFKTILSASNHQTFEQDGLTYRIVSIETLSHCRTRLELERNGELFETIVQFDLNLKEEEDGMA